MKKRITRKFLALFMTVAVVSASFSTFALAEEDSAKYDEISIQIAKLPSLNPFGTDVVYPYIAEMYESLFIIDGFAGDMVPVLADANRGEFGGYDHEEGSGDYTVYIYDYITDSAGNPMTASDIKFSYDLIQSSYNTSEWGDYEGCEVVDDTTIIFHFTHEMNGLSGVSDVFTEAYMVTEAAYNDSPTQFSSDACGTGPYVEESYTDGVNIVEVAREDYWQTDPSLTPDMLKQNVNKINFELITEEAQTVIALQTGDIDIGQEIAADNLSGFEEGGQYADDFTIYTYKSNGTFYMLPNCSEESLCNDINLRLALFYAVDTNGIEQGLGSDTASAAYTIGNDCFPDYNYDWESEENYQTVCDPDLAKEYLEKSSYNGETLTFMTTTETLDVCQIILQMWENVGINAELFTCDSASFDAFKGDPENWDVLITAGGSSNYLAVLWSRVFDTSVYGNGLTQNYIDDPEWDELRTSLLYTDTHTADNMNLWWQTCLDNAYGMGLYYLYNHNVYINDVEELSFTCRENIMPGGCTYVTE